MGRLSFLKEITIVSNTYVASIFLALCFYVRASANLGSLRKSWSTPENFRTPAITVDTMFSKTTEQHSNSIVHMVAFYFIYMHLL